MQNQQTKNRADQHGPNNLRTLFESKYILTFFRFSLLEPLHKLMQHTLVHIGYISGRPLRRFEPIALSGTRQNIYTFSFACQHCIGKTIGEVEITGSNVKFLWGQNRFHKRFNASRVSVNLLLRSLQKSLNCCVRTEFMFVSFLVLETVKKIQRYKKESGD